MLQGDATKIRRRLLTVARRREIQLGRQGIERPEELSRQVDAAIEASQSESEDDPISAAIAGGAPAGCGWQLVELIRTPARFCR